MRVSSGLSRSMVAVYMVATTEAFCGLWPAKGFNGLVVVRRQAARAAPGRVSGIPAGHATGRPYLTVISPSMPISLWLSTGQYHS